MSDAVALALDVVEQAIRNLAATAEERLNTPASVGDDLLLQKANEAIDVLRWAVRNTPASVGDDLLQEANKSLDLLRWSAHLLHKPNEAPDLEFLQKFGEALDVAEWATRKLAAAAEERLKTPADPDFLSFPKKARKLLLALHNRADPGLATSALLKAVYGSTSKENLSALLHLKDRTNARLAKNGDHREIKKTGDAWRLMHI